MKTFGRILMPALLLAGISLPAMAQKLGYEPPRRANQKDVYCSGFVASQRLPEDLRIIMGEDALGRITYGQRDFVYLSRGANGGVQEGQRYFVVRPMSDPNPIKAFGRQRAILNSIGQLYEDIGRVAVHVVHATTATAEVVEACDPLQPGDILVPFQPRPQPAYKPARAFDRFTAPSGRAEGTVILGKDFGHTMGEGDPIYINLGSGQGVELGDYYTIFRYASGSLYEGDKGVRRGQTDLKRLRGVNYDVPDIREDLPREVLGEAFVVHVDQHSSTAVITLSLTEVHAGDFVELQPPAPPLARLTVIPASIPRGETATLSWNVQGAQQATIAPGVGAVSGRGSAQVSPERNTTYTLNASGRGGSVEDTATLEVIQPPPPPPPPPPAPKPPAPSLQELFAQNVEDIFFDFDKFNIKEQAAAKLQRAAEFLLAHPEIRILIEGHADEIYTEEYNLALGGRRAEATKNYLVQLGVSAERIDTVSLGESQPFCTESSEEWCRALNRRSHFVMQQ